MSEWTPARVEERLRKAIGVGSPLAADHFVSRGKPEGIGIIGGIGVGTNGDGVVADAAEALSWLRWLEPDDADIVVARLEGAPWKLICWRFGISRPTADRRWRYALALIAWRLNGQGKSGRTPSLRSILKQSFVRAGVRHLPPGRDVEGAGNQGRKRGIRAPS